MVRIVVDVENGAARFRVAVWAVSLRRALEIAERRNPGRRLRVVSSGGKRSATGVAA
jgi:hypothetical protein